MSFAEIMITRNQQMDRNRAAFKSLSSHNTDTQWMLSVAILEIR